MYGEAARVMIAGACRRTLRQSGLVLIATAGVIAVGIGVAIFIWPSILAFELANLRTVPVENGEKYTIEGDRTLFAIGVLVNLVWAAWLLNGIAALIEYSEADEEEVSSDAE
jgi:hypothetical protein